MKNYCFLLILLLASCQKETKKVDESQTSVQSTVEQGETLFTQNNCTACHKVDQKVVGPSLQDIAKIYKEQNADMVAFLKEEAEPIVDPTMYETMKINLQITKTMTDEELKALENYMLSFAK